MLIFLLNAIKIIFLLGFLILIHEGGHFLVAKLSKIKVNEFAIGFGPTIWRKQGKETKYALRLVPLGGFVNMEGEEQYSNAQGSFSIAPMYKRVAIVLAGAIVNILIGLLLYFCLISAIGGNISTTIAQINQDVSMLQAGDTIKKVNGHSIRIIADLDKYVAASNGEVLEMEVIRNGEWHSILQEPNTIERRAIGIYFAEETNKAQIKAILANSPAQKAGFEANDVILSVNGEDSQGSSEKVKELINNSEGELQIEVERKGNKITLQVVADAKKYYNLGTTMEYAEESFGTNVYYGFWETKDFAFSIVDNLKMLFTGNVSADQFMGPIGIGEVVAKTSGVEDFVYVLAVISLSLGVTNLLPFPPLDGGKTVFLLIEAVRKKPLKEELEARIQMIGFAAIILLSIYVAYNDVLRLF